LQWCRMTVLFPIWKFQLLTNASILHVLPWVRTCFLQRIWPECQLRNVFNCSISEHFVWPSHATPPRTPPPFSVAMLVIAFPAAHKWKRKARHRPSLFLSPESSSRPGIPRATILNLLPFGEVRAGWRELLGMAFN